MTACALLFPRSPCSAVAELRVHRRRGAELVHPAGVAGHALRVVLAAEGFADLWSKNAATHPVPGSSTQASEGQLRRGQRSISLCCFASCAHSPGRWDTSVRTSRPADAAGSKTRTGQRAGWSSSMPAQAASGTKQSRTLIGCQLLCGALRAPQAGDQTQKEDPASRSRCRKRHKCEEKKRAK